MTAIEAAEAQHARGKLTALERIELLLDAGSLVRASNASGGESVVTGYGTIHGRRIFVSVQDYTVSQGSLSAADAKTITAMQERATTEHAPLIYLIDSDGLRFEDGLAALAAYGEIIKHGVESTSVNPQISLIMGPCIGAAAFAARLADFVFMVAETSSLCVTGPRIANRFTEENSTIDALGGATFNMQTSGLADATYDNDIEALSQLRRFIDFLPASHQDHSQQRLCFDRVDRLELSLDTLVPDDAATPYEVIELILKTVDENDFFELQAEFAKNIVIGFARMQGQTIGIAANQPLVLGGVIDTKAARKAERFVHFCNRFHIPLVTFVDTPGFLPGPDQEQSGLANEGAKLMFAYAAATTPKITVITGQAYGAAYTMMGSKQLDADRVLAWPSARIGLMNETDARFSCAEAQAKGMVDAIIAPHKTRVEILAALSALRETSVAHKIKMLDDDLL